MKLLTKNLEANHNYFFFGDQHHGSVLSSKSGWNKLLDMMCSEYEGCSNNYGSDGGDMFEAIMVDDPRFSEEKLNEPLPLEQMKSAVKNREPIKDKLVTILMGNHERKLWKFGNLTAEVCEQLGVEYGTYTAKISIRDSKDNLMYKIYQTHGFRGASSSADDPIRRQSNLRLSIKRHLKFKAADCAVMVKHHIHKLIVSKPETELYLVDDGKKVKQQYTSWGQNEPYIHPDARWYGAAGSFMKLYEDGMSGYAEMAEYDPVELGFLVLRVRDKKIAGLDPVYLKI